MKVHHVNCATLCPPGGRLFGPLINETGSLVCHCLLIETEAGLVLVDTGLGTADVAAAGSRLTEAFRRLTGPVLRAEETALRQVAALGFVRNDVRHIIVTHLDLDHAGGLSDFPAATVHVHVDELAAARSPRLRERPRYLPSQWAHGPVWSAHRPGGEPWFGFECVRALPGLPPEVLLVPLAGHTRGHCAVAVDTGERWLLHAGDAYFFHGETDPVKPHCTPGLALIQRLNEVDHAARMANQLRLRALRRDHATKVRVFCSHDPTELRRLVQG